MNITEKILARGAGESKLEPGDVKFAKIDKVMLHDVSGPGVIKTFELSLIHISEPTRPY